FGNQAINTTSAAQTINLTNTQSTALAIASLTTSGAFAQTNTCGSSVPAQGKCTISVTFTPSLLGGVTGTLTVIDSGTNSPQTVSLSGTGVAHLARMKFRRGTPCGCPYGGHPQGVPLRDRFGCGATALLIPRFFARREDLVRRASRPCSSMAGTAMPRLWLRLRRSAPPPKERARSERVEQGRDSYLNFT